MTIEELHQRLTAPFEPNKDLNPAPKANLELIKAKLDRAAALEAFIEADRRLYDLERKPDYLRMPVIA